jgi:hypothetical protein
MYENGGTQVFSDVITCILFRPYHFPLKSHRSHHHALDYDATVQISNTKAVD